MANNRTKPYGVQEFPNSAAIVTNPNGNAAIVTLSARTTSRDIGKLIPVSVPGAPDLGKIKSWGQDNLLPNKIDNILCDNNISGELMTTKRDIIRGKGIKPYVEVVDGDIRKRMPVSPSLVQEPTEWMEKNRFMQDFITPGINNLVKLQMNFTSIMPTRDGTRISSVKAIEAKYVRLGEKNKNGQIPFYVLSGDWEDMKEKKSSLPAYRIGMRQEAMLHHGDNFFNDGYYNIPTWMGGIEWVELANAIPKFHKSNLSNGYTLRYHIEIPKDYFLDKNKIQQVQNNEAELKKCIDAAEEKRRAFLDKVNDILAGIDNAGRTIWSTTEIDRLLKLERGIKITPITTDMKDQALLELFEKSNQAVISGQGLHPTLANVETAGKLSSGSEMRNALTVYTAIKTRTYRENILEIWKLVAAVNGWDVLRDEDGNLIQWDFEDIMITKLDDDKSGQAALPQESTPQTNAN